MTKNSSETLLKRNALRQHWKDTVPAESIPQFILGKCKQCGERKRKRWANTFTQTGNPEYRSRCGECDRKFIRDQQRRARKSISRSAKIRKASRKAECVSYLGGKCSECGYSKSNHALTFHHKLRSDKTRDISSMLDYAWTKLRAELDRCVLVCFNCHMEIEEGHRSGE